MKKTILLLVVVIMVLVISCRKKKHETDFSECTPVTYTKDIRALLDVHCNNIECHGANQAPVLTYYAAVKSTFDNGNFRQAVINDRTMPKEAKLSDEDYDLFNCWLEAGAPE